MQTGDRVQAAADFRLVGTVRCVRDGEIEVEHVSRWDRRKFVRQWYPVAMFAPVKRYA